MTEEKENSEEEEEKEDVEVIDGMNYKYVTIDQTSEGYTLRLSQNENEELGRVLHL